jgi:predicted aspartyl protease
VPKGPQSALTLKGNGRLRELRSDVKVGIPMALGAGVITSAQPFQAVTTAQTVRAVWDTGATGTVITRKIVDELHLQPITMVDVVGANSTGRSFVYLVDLHLPNNVVMGNLNVTLADLGPATDVLIGMDVITQGDFVVSNKDGKTTMSFRLPSLWSCDFVAEMNRSNSPGSGRATPKGTQPAPRRKPRRR